MTDTGQVPGEGLPENSGMVEQPGIPAPGAYTFLDPSEHAAEDDDLLLMPGAQGAWSEHPPGMPPAPPVAVPAPQAPLAAPVVPNQATPQQGAPHAAGPHPAAPETAVPMGDPLTDPLPDPLTGPLPDSFVLADVLTAPQGQTPPQGVPLAQAVATPAHGTPAHATPAHGVPVHGTPAHGVPAAAQEPVVADHGYEPGILDTGAHEAAGRDTGSVDLGGVRVPPPAAAPTPPPARRPLHMGPPVPDVTGGVVLSLADRGPAAAPVQVAQPAPVVATGPAPMPVRNPGPPTTGPEYFDIPQDQQLAPQGAEPWAAQPQEAMAPQPVLSAETVVPQSGQFVQVEGVVPTAPHLAPTPVAEAEEPAQAAAPEQTEEPAAPELADAVATVPAPREGEPAAEAPVLVTAEAAEPEPAVEVAPVAVPEAEQAPEAAAESQPEPVEAEVAPEAPVEQAPEETPVVTEDIAEALPEQTPEAEPAPEALAPEQPAAADTVTASDEQSEPAVEAAEAEEPAEAVAPQADLAVAPETVAPETVAPETVTPETAAPETAVPDATAPETVTPETVTTEAGTPEAEPAEAPEAPETETVPEGFVDATELVEADELGDAEVPSEAAEPSGTDATRDAEQGDTAESGEAEEVPAPGTPDPGAPAPGYADAEREAVLRVMRERRDIRNGFRSDPIPHEVLLRVLEAAHTAPSVGHSQPWDFVVIRSAETRQTMHELAQRQRDAYAKSLPKARAKQFKELKIEAILDTPVNIVVTADPTRGGRHTLGRYTQPQMAPYSSALAVENLWLAARAEGLGVGWVSFFDEREMVRTLGLPDHLEVVAYLCVGYVDEFPEEPELMQAGWSKRRPLAWVVHEETYGRRALPGEEPHDLLQETVANIRPLDAKALGEAWERQKRMTKPAGALGMLEIISAQLSGLSRMCPPPIPEPAAVAIFAGDHGVHAQGVTPWPQEVTGQMVANFLGGGAVCNAFANQVGAEVCVIDVGVASELPATPGLLPRKVRPGTGDFTTGLAMTRDEVLAAIEVGIETARDLVAAGNKAILTGEMGIANTTASAALISVYTGVDAAEVTGRGTGINDETHARKVDVVRRALDLHKPDPADPIGVLSAIGGLEHAALVGLILGAASLRTPVILDGVSTGAAALVARAVAPESLAACIAGHRSAEPGHVAALNKLGLRPLVDLDLRLGEGTGALLALPLVQSAARAMHEVATFDSAGVTEK
ncbi:nicotinate-nucleotide--dimethylbenzimidazole phosphoribosyltransferase [Streptomyces sp. NBC_00094]|uniref:nicotinate-nucleotide--dimethylbenzimidazole phosphoribosyltransferase n=1 Tax=Streptomyces sp. NBC_00094 TaxID=2903620 RepID=UPI00224DB6A7|nr:nicotinate-nucleotide--dimethylbenzimidazole phosphoribosyltransferase [Streptomyces sp. NBC_00094]MCX5389597.1 nicotinate-nucleotide--dimethylbenzimidazole phosphoribosyltransferase [Streptomyces sp. NBC_00094]